MMKKPISGLLKTAAEDQSPNKEALAFELHCAAGIALSLMDVVFKHSAKDERGHVTFKSSNMEIEQLSFAMNEVDRRAGELSDLFAKG
jgi:hypothetical protein